MPYDLSTVRHSLAHILAMAILKRDPGATLGTGPSTEDGFFYDILFSEGQNVSPDDFKSIIEDMRSIVKKKLPFVQRLLTADEARELFKKNPFKLEIIGEAESRGEDITIFETGDFVERDGVVAEHLHVLPQLAEVLDDVVGEAIVVVDHQQHKFIFPTGV